MSNAVQGIVQFTGAPAGAVLTGATHHNSGMRLQVEPQQEKTGQQVSGGFTVMAAGDGEYAEYIRPSVGTYFDSAREFIQAVRQRGGTRATHITNRNCLRLDSDRPTMGRPLEDLVRSYELSSYRESLLAQLFIAELLQGCWIAGLRPVEIDRPEVDFQGYDLVATCEGIVRHIQLKATRGRIVVHRALAEKPSACVVNLEPSVAGTPSRIRFTYRFFGAPAGAAIELDGLRPARKVFNTRGEDGEFGKAERPNHVQVPSTRFKAVGDVEALARLLFVPAS
jgi:hypothetical protein